jgi:hypothetical protein
MEIKRRVNTQAPEYLKSCLGSVILHKVVEVIARLVKSKSLIYKMHLEMRI